MGWETLYFMMPWHHPWVLVLSAEPLPVNSGAIWQYSLDCACVRAREGEMDINTRSDIAIVWGSRVEKGRNGFDAWHQRAPRPADPHTLLVCKFVPEADATSVWTVGCVSDMGGMLRAKQATLEPSSVRATAFIAAPSSIWGGIQWACRRIYARRFCAPCSRSVTI